MICAVSIFYGDFSLPFVGEGDLRGLPLIAAGDALLFLGEGDLERRGDLEERLGERDLDLDLDLLPPDFL